MKTVFRIPHWIVLGEVLALVLALNSLSSYLSLPRAAQATETRQVASGRAPGLVLHAAVYRRVAITQPDFEPLRRSMAINAAGAFAVAGVLAAIALRMKPEDEKLE
jgi:NAD(P)-dependent dehydrogenase (short-subunit alcohol dehydrogenase family)